MARNILITGASGYLGGQMLSQLSTAQLPAHGNIFALVRSDEHAEGVKKLGLEPLRFNPFAADEVEDHIVKHDITVVYWLIEAMEFKGQPLFIKALAKLGKQTGVDVHFLHTTGAKIFSNMAGSPSDQPLLDNDPDLYEIQAKAQADNPMLQQANETNKAVIDLSEQHGVRSYIFTPCIVYGENQGFGNQISIQTKAIVLAAKAARRVYKVDTDRPTWPVCHNEDNASLYIEILRNILQGKEIPSGKNGHYLAASGSVAWDDLYAALAKALAKRGVVDNDTVELADDAALELMAQGIETPKQFVRLQLGGKCTFEARNGPLIGWKPRYAAEHILEAADAEVELILKHT